MVNKQGNVILQDNIQIAKPEIPQRLTVKRARPSYFIQDNRSAYQKEQSNKIRTDREKGKALYSNQHLWNIDPTRQITSQNANAEFQNNKEAIKAAMVAGTGAMAITAPIAAAGSVIGDWAVDKLVQNHTDKNSWGELVQDKTGVGNSQAWELTNPGGLLGGIYGAEKQSILGGKKLLSKFLKGDSDLGWNALDTNHWVFNSASPMNVALAATNRIAPFLNATEKIPGKVGVYQLAKRTNGNASISIKDALTNSPTYKGTLPGTTGKNILGFYMFNDTPFINKSNWFKNISKRFRPIDKNEQNRGFSHGERYDNIYPGINERRYYMSSVVEHNRPLNLTGEEATNYIGGNIGKTVGKETATVMPRGDGKWIKFKDNPEENWAFPLDDIAGHMTKLQYNKGQLKQTSQDLWKFNPKDYSARWGDTPTGTESVRLTKQAALMDKLGRPFILQQSNPINIERRRVLAPAMQQGGVIEQDNTRIVKPRIKENSIPYKYSFRNLGGSPSPNITQEQRWKRQKKERTWEDNKNLLRGLNNTVGRAASLASFIYGGGWAATRLLNGNKASAIGQTLSKYVLPTNTIDAIGDVSQLVEDPSISNAAEVGISLGLGKWKDFGKVGRQVSELGSQGLNAYNSYRQGGRFTFRKNPLIKDAEKLNGKRDMRKKVIKSNTKYPDYKRRIQKGASGIKFVSYDEPTSVRNADFSSIFQTDYKYPTINNYSFKEEQPEQPKEQPEEQLPMEEEKKVVPAKFTGNKDFITQMKPAFTEALTKRGLDPKYADYLVAQSAFESGWGKHQSGKFNFGGIKGKGTIRKTREVINGKDVYINDSFRDFNSVNDYADYHVGLLNNKRYNAFNSEDFIDSVVKGGYATDPNYKSVLSKIYKQIVNA